MKWHSFFNLVTMEPAFSIAWFLFFFIFHLAMLPYNLSPWLAVACLAFWAWSVGFSSIFPKKCVFCCLPHISIIRCILQTASLGLFMLSVTKSPRYPQLFLFSFFLFFILNDSLHSPHVPFCLLSQKTQHFDFFRVFVFPWWREYYNLFLWLTSFEWYKLQIDFLIF